MSMPPKSQKTSGGRARPGEEEKDEVLQAVVLADTFETKFAPFTLDRPRCLLPLLNTPLIEYTLEYLAGAGVHEVYLYAGAHVDQVETYVNASKWKLSTSPFKKLVFLKTVATSIGDIMRDLDQKALIAGDFLCISGDIVSNFPIDEALRKHKARREKDKNAIMTMLLRESSGCTFPSLNSTVPTFVIDPSKDRCLHYEESLAGESSSTNIEPEIISTPEIDIRQDLVDCRIDICTPDVLSLWSDNFDNQSPRKDFLHGVLKDYELNGKTIHTYITTNHYAARIGDLLSYGVVSQDLMRRRAVPLTLENNVFTDISYKIKRKGVYQESEVLLARSCVIEPITVLGRGTTVGAGSVIRNSVIGRRCHIGKNVTLDGAYIWDDATVGNDVKVWNAIIANEASIGDRCSIGEDALLSFGVRVASGTSVPAGMRLTRSTEGGGASRELHDDENAEEISKAPGLVYSNPAFASSSDSLSSTESEGSDAPSTFVGSRSESFATTIADDDGGRFHQEAVSSLFHRMEENNNPDDISVELMGLRFASNATPHQVRKAIAVALMKYIQHQIDSEKGSPATATKKALEQYRILVAREGTQDTAEDQVDFLLQAQRDLVHRSNGRKILLFLTKELYDMEVFGEDVFMSWWDDEKSSSEGALQTVREETGQFITWLKNAESESEGEEDDEE